jgi:tetratricopeptide (TPR) repeat protein
MPVSYSTNSSYNAGSQSLTKARVERNKKRHAAGVLFDFEREEAEEQARALAIAEGRDIADDKDALASDGDASDDDVVAELSFSDKVRLANALMRVGAVEQAIDTIDEAIELHPDNTTPKQAAAEEEVEGGAKKRARTSKANVKEVVVEEGEEEEGASGKGASSAADADAEQDFSALKVAQLRKELTKRGLDTTGLKAVLLKRLKQAAAAAATAAAATAAGGAGRKRSRAEKGGGSGSAKRSKGEGAGKDRAAATEEEEEDEDEDDEEEEDDNDGEEEEEGSDGDVAISVAGLVVLKGDALLLLDDTAADEEATACFADALQLFRTALADAPPSSASPHLLASLIAVSKLGATQHKLGRPADALATYGEGIAMGEGVLHGAAAEEAAMRGAMSSLYAACAATHAASAAGSSSSGSSSSGGGGGGGGATMEAAIDVLRRGAARFPAYADVQYNLGAALCAAGRHAEAIAPFRASCEHAAPASADTWGELANALLETGDDDGAWEARAARRRILKVEQEAADAEAVRKGKKGRVKECWGGHGGKRKLQKKQRASATEILSGQAGAATKRASLGPQKLRAGASSHGVPNKKRNVKNKIGAQTSLLSKKKAGGKLKLQGLSKW